MGEYTWSKIKNDSLLLTRGISFKIIISEINKGNLVDDQPHENQQKYPDQRVFIVKINDYAYVVPYRIINNTKHLITIFPSRKVTKKFLNKKNG